MIPDYTLLTSNDAKPGSTLQSLRHLKSDALVVHIGNCLSCSSQSFKLSDLDGAKSPVLVHYIGSAPPWTKDAARKRIAVREDMEADAAAEVNLAWHPRWARVGAGGKLTRLQSNPNERATR
jgi:hypothetical protein